MLNPANTVDPLDIEIVPGTKVRDIQSVDECTTAVLRLENDISRIVSQIARSESEPATVQPGWSSRAQGAIRWKKTAIRALNARAILLKQAQAGGARSKGVAILKVIREDIGETAFEGYVETARLRYPEVFPEEL